MPDQSEAGAPRLAADDLLYFAARFAHVEFMVHTPGPRPLLLVDGHGRELDEATARRLADDHGGAVFHWGELAAPDPPPPTVAGARPGAAVFGADEARLPQRPGSAR